MVMDFSKMCDRCFKTLGKDEAMYAFNVWDDKGEKISFKGHDTCIEEMRELLKVEGSY